MALGPPRSTAVDLTNVAAGVVVPTSPPAATTAVQTAGSPFAAATVAAGVVLGAPVNAARIYGTIFNNTDVDLLVKLDAQGAVAPVLTTSNFQDKIPSGQAGYFQPGEKQALWMTAPGATTGQVIVTEEA